MDTVPMQPWKRWSRCSASFRITFFRTTLLFLLLILSGCGSDKDLSVADRSRQGGTLYFGVESPFYGLDILGGGSGGILLPDMKLPAQLIMEPLFRVDRSGKSIPVLGLSATPSPDGLSWTIPLRRGVLFHDGAPFGADAVVHHWNRMLDPENRFRGRRLLQPIQSVEKIDDHTVRFQLVHPWPAFLPVISDEQCLSSYIPSPGAVAAGTQDRKPAGTGPFRHHTWSGSDHYVVMKNEAYWDRKAPLLNKIVFRVIPDHQARYASLKAGELDAIVLDRGHLIRRARSDDTLHVYSSEGNGAEIVLLNTRRPPLDDVRVRRALALASNQALHVKMVYGDAIPFVHHPFGEWFPCGEDRYPHHDQAEARRLIAEYGKPVVLECLHSNTSRGRQVGELLQRLYKEIGVTLNPVGLSTGPVVVRVMQNDFQMTTWRLLAANDAGPQLFRNFHSGSPTNHAGYHSPEMDRLLEAQRIETDPEKRRRFLCRIAALINTDVPLFYRGGRRYNIVSAKRIRDFTSPSENRLTLAAAWIDEAVNFNAKAFAIEQKAAVPEIDCKDPGDVEAIKALVQGTWQGKDSWGSDLTFTFNEDGTVTGQRSGSNPKTGKYRVCGNTIYIRASAEVNINVFPEKLEGGWKKASYEGTFTLTRI